MRNLTGCGLLALLIAGSPLAAPVSRADDMNSNNQSSAYGRSSDSDNSGKTQKYEEYNCCIADVCCGGSK